MCVIMGEEIFYYRKKEGDIMEKRLLDFEVGEIVDLFLLIKLSVKGMVSNGKLFLSFVL